MSAVSVEPTIFREYIGGKSKKSQSGVPFDNVPIDQNVKELHFILAFARDDNKGNFLPQWHRGTYNDVTIANIKKVPNVTKVVLSIGGPRGSPISFNPSDKDVWTSNAINSLTRIINEFNLDGIDVNYEKIDATPIVFADCIGSLIKALKSDGVITVASIAPSNDVDSHYVTLYKQITDSIDWVNYQFYNEDVPSLNLFVSRYKTLANNSYTKPGIILPGLSTDPNDANKLKPEVFKEGCKKLIGEKKLAGAFIWDADDSDQHDFVYEQITQKMLVNPS